MEDLRQLNNNVEPENMDIKEILNSYLRYWYFFVITILIAVACAFIYLRYAPRVYNTTATIVIQKESSSGLPEGLAGLASFSGFFGRMNQSKLQNDLIIFNSRRLNVEIVKALDLNISYHLDGNIKDSELYKNSPIAVKYLSFNDSLANPLKQNAPNLFLKILSNTTYEVVEKESANVKTYNFGELVSLAFGDITVVPSLSSVSSFIGKTIIVSYNSIENVSSSYRDRLQVLNTVKNSNVIDLSVISTIPEKTEDYINETVYQFNKDASYDKQQIAQNTSTFINERLDIIARELDSVEGNKESFKTKNKLTDIAAEMQMTLQNANEFERKQFDIGMQLELSKSMIQFVDEASSDDLLPSNVGLNAENVAQSVSNYNQLVLERNRLLKNSTSKNPVIVNITNQINQLKSNISSSLVNALRDLELTMKDLNIQESRLNSKISKVPVNERLYRGIERQQTIKEQLYLFLLTQREQANISLSVSSPKAKVVDFAYTSKAPIAPQNLIIYLGALISGLIIPFLIIYVNRMLSTTIKNRKDIERKLSTINISGEIPKLKKGQEDLIQDNDRSVLAESFRILRTNIQYLFVNKNIPVDRAKRIFVTSTIKGEGKTFIAFNLALSLSTTKKRVVLIGADIRNPQLQRYLPKGSKALSGVTEFIVDRDLKAKDLVLKSDYLNLDILLSGAIPPNPAELLMQDRTEDIFKELEGLYDYIIVDTAPSMLVTDTILINKYADIMLYVARADYTDKRLLEFPKDAIEDGRLSNVSMVLNNVSMTNFGYGNKYGYAYSEDKPSFFKRMFGRE
jgi:capsular exopolysaccharide synthesis family protein